MKVVLSHTLSQQISVNTCPSFEQYSALIFFTNANHCSKTQNDYQWTFVTGVNFCAVFLTRQYIQLSSGFIAPLGMCAHRSWLFRVCLVTVYYRTDFGKGEI